MQDFFNRSGIFQFGKIIPGLSINGKPAPYAVLNERAVRAGAGINFVLGIIGFSNGFFLKNYLPLKVIVAIFFIDFFIKVFIGTRFSPISRIAELIVDGQKPDYVGAIQKRFAWSIGLMMSFSMILVLYVFQLQGPLSMTICGICLTIMWLETSFGICVGCKLYYGLMNLGMIAKPEIAPACPGGACPIKLPA